MKLSLLSMSVFALAIAACHPSAQLQAPDGFAQLEGQKSYDWRAASAQGVVLAVRTEKNEPRANVDFWADAIDLRLRRAGYGAEARKDVTSANGVAGKQLRFSRVEAQRTYRYWLTVFVTQDRVYVVEAGGDKDSFDPAEKTVERAVLTVRAG